MRKKILIGNWKMNLINDEAIKFVKSCKSIIKIAIRKKIDIGIAPTYISLFSVKKNAPKKLIIVSQNVHYLSSGAFTGEISSEMLKSIDIKYVIIGHSERRKYFNETNLTCNLKIKKLLNDNMIPIYCCGESSDIHNKNETKKFIKNQIIDGFNNISKKNIDKIIIAYEPIWAIGTGKNANIQEVENICCYIRNEIIKKNYGDTISKKIRIIYGGSVNENNVHDYTKLTNIDGVLVGSCSLNFNSFKKILCNL